MELLDFREPVSAWTHFSWMLLAVPGTLFLWRLSRGDRIKQLALLIFGLSCIACYAGSTLYHSVRLPPAQVAACETVDQIGIYLLIAGSYTPLGLTLLEGRWRWGSLTLIWLVAAVGIALRSLYWNLPPWLYNGLYLSMGWGVAICYFELARVLSHRALLAAVLGGVLYSIGAIVNLVKWPVPWPGVVGPHELLHLFVMAATFTHFSFMLRHVVPFERSGPATPIPCSTEREDDLFGTGLEPGRSPA